MREREVPNLSFSEPTARARAVFLNSGHTLTEINDGYAGSLQRRTPTLGDESPSKMTLFCNQRMAEMLKINEIDGGGQNDDYADSCLFCDFSALRIFCRFLFFCLAPLCDKMIQEGHLY